MVFRRLSSPSDFARAGITERRADETWSGLWNLTAEEGDRPAAIAVTRQLTPGVVEIKSIRTVCAYGVKARLVREIADACRARGVEWLVAAADDGNAEALRRAGFAPMPGRAGWLALQL